MNPIAGCLSFFTRAVPRPTSKNLNTQIGCHFEEVNEMMAELDSRDKESAEILRQAMFAVHKLAEHAKQGSNYSIHPENRINYLDALCDQIVTAVGCAHMSNMNIIGGFIETNRSNLSKFGEDGQPIFNENMKVIKGPNYTQSDLTPFV